ncbi:MULTISPECIES: ThiF family adenylyltransferase [unclassified Streptomyces]|uniref:ThiF family adenylyltransferase n=1 Tax=unclassified Streptomyces TaxID=2593676 RepID=UPI00131E02BA|nr:MULTISPECIES: ThiF family adenylyltransferase [unclassified Streptomyces]
MNTDYSRGVRLGGLAAGVKESTLRERMEATLVHLTANGRLPAASETLEVLVADLRRWPVRLSLDPGRGPGRLDAPLIRRLVERATEIDPDRPLRVGEAQGQAPLHLHVGTAPPPGSTVAGAPDGHGVRLRRTGHPFPRLNAPGTGLGAVLTAAMLAGEAFKVVAGLPEGKFQVIPVVDFCPVLPGEQPGIAVTPLPALKQVLLGGGGAIGTGIALVLDLLETTGELTVVDKEVFEKPNVTSYSIGTSADAAAGLPKVRLIDAHLRRIEVTPFHGTIQASIEAVDAGTLPWPRIVLGGLDSVEARHDLQRLHADLILDGSTGGPVGTTVALHEALPTGPCLRCFFKPNHTGKSAEQRLNELTGLPLSRIARGQEPLTERDLEGLVDQQRELVEQFLGRPVCGLINSSELKGKTDHGFRPSAAFVAQQAACLVVGAWIARSTGLSSGPSRRIEYDTRFGPRPDQMIDHRLPTPGCVCQKDSALINRIREARRSRL